MAGVHASGQGRGAWTRGGSRLGWGGLFSEVLLEGNGLHDFLIGSSAIATHGFPAIVGSLEQLDASLVSPLFLARIRLALHTSGKILPEIVTDRSSLFDGLPEAKGTFDILVLKAGFLWAFSDRYKRRFSHANTRIMLVSAGWMLPAMRRLLRRCPMARGRISSRTARANPAAACFRPASHSVLRPKKSRKVRYLVFSRADRLTAHQAGIDNVECPERQGEADQDE